MAGSQLALTSTEYWIRKGMTWRQSQSHWRPNVSKYGAAGAIALTDEFVRPIPGKGFRSAVGARGIVIGTRRRQADAAVTVGGKWLCRTAGVATAMATLPEPRRATFTEDPRVALDR